MQRTEKQDIYTRITNQIVSHLEKGVRPWVRPWNAEHAAGRITRPLRHNGKPYSGINVLSLGKRHGAKLRGAHLDDLQTSIGARRSYPQGRERLARRLRGQHHAKGDRRKNWRRNRPENPIPQRVHRFQCRADRRLAGSLLRESLCTFQHSATGASSIFRAQILFGSRLAYGHTYPAFGAIRE